MSRVEELVDGAVAAARERRWGDAGALYARAAMWAGDDAGAGVVRRAWSAAGEAWRRDDHPQLAIRALRTALALTQDDPQEVALDRLRLAAALAEAGNGSAAIDLCRAALAGAEGPVRATAADSLVGNLLAFGHKEDARRVVAELDDPIARRFRDGELARLDGRLADAAAAFDEVLAALEGPEADAGRAAALAELGEIALWRGDTVAAVERFERAACLHRDAGRRALAWRAEAGRVRAMVEGGLAPIVAALDDGIAFAVGRGVALLEIDLRLARGQALADRDPHRAADDLGRAVELADRAGARLRGGHARLAQARVASSAEERRRSVGAALPLLVDAAPLHELARALLDEGGDAPE